MAESKKRWHPEMVYLRHENQRVRHLVAATLEQVQTERARALRSERAQRSLERQVEHLQEANRELERELDSRDAEIQAMTDELVERAMQIHKLRATAEAQAELDARRATENARRHKDASQRLFLRKARTAQELRSRLLGGASLH